MAKTLSIVIPTYNMEKYLRHCLDSLIVSDDLMDQLEVLVVNDGSKDNSSAIAHEYESKYPQTFKVIDKENGNYGSCINVGLKNASGKYIKVLDADDSFDTSSFSAYLTYLSDIDVDLIVSDYNLVNENGEVSKSETFDFPEKQVMDYQTMSSYASFPFIQMHSTAYRTENLIKIGYHQTEGISYTDQEWMFAPVTTVKTGVYFKTPLYKYLIGREGQTMDPRVMVRSVSHTKLGFQSMLKFFSNSQYDACCSKYLTYRLQTRMQYIYSAYLTQGFDIDLNELVSFDEELKRENKSMYDIADGFSVGKIFKYKYVREWRKTYYKVQPFSASLRLFLSRWINKIETLKKMMLDPRFAILKIRKKLSL